MSLRRLLGAWTRLGRRAADPWQRSLEDFRARNRDWRDLSKLAPMPGSAPTVRRARPTLVAPLIR